MQYFGGKQRVAEGIASYLNGLCPPYFLEPFVGGLNVLPRIESPLRIGADLCTPLITMYRALQEGWDPPQELSEEEYIRIKDIRDPYDPVTALAGFGCSFAGKWFGGYARRADPTSFAAIARRSLLRKFARVRPSDQFLAADFRSWDPIGAVVYCDPPYLGATAYGYAPGFPSDEFWAWVRWLSRRNSVLVSEYRAPEDFVAGASFPTSTSIRDASGKTIPRIEKLFQLRTDGPNSELSVVSP
jgi:DNA adenine methylase